MAVKVADSFTVLEERPHALRIKSDATGKTYWIPKSAIDDDSEVYAAGTSGELVAADWWCEKNGVE